MVVIISPHRSFSKECLTSDFLTLYTVIQPIILKLLLIRIVQLLYIVCNLLKEKEIDFGNKMFSRGELYRLDMPIYKIYI